MMFWHKKTDLSEEQRELDKLLDKGKKKLELSREEFHNLKAVSANIIGDYVQILVERGHK